MIKNNITPISSQPDESSSITLDGVIEALENWRKNKTHFNERIPATIWEQIFVLLDSIPESKIRRAAGLSGSQFRQALDEHNQRKNVIDTQPQPNPKPKKNQEQIDFCEVVAPNSPLDYKPAKAFTTTTSVVELYRPDGMLMKIHICTDRFEELLRAFCTI